ncbi:hypothetical protein F4X10_23750 [Candidatus Poribacteria bacterium]|nr:hypothetical protein [Candidatus Poribacteria bacterium]
MRKKILIIAIAALLMLGFLPISLDIVSPPEAEAGKFHIECDWIIETNAIYLFCWWETHDH